jgi:hypothetical protein
VRLGDIDSEGCFVGYITEEGIAYPSRAVAEISDAAHHALASLSILRNAGDPLRPQE